MSEWEVVCIILSVLGSITGLLLYLRHVSQINIHSGRPPIKNITFAYKFKEGPYKHWEEVVMECRSIEYKVANIRVLYDDPKKVNMHVSSYAMVCFRVLVPDVLDFLVMFLCLKLTTRWR